VLSVPKWLVMIAGRTEMALSFGPGNLERGPKKAS
jgi:hypothetical protein